MLEKTPNAKVLKGKFVRLMLLQGDESAKVVKLIKDLPERAPAPPLQHPKDPSVSVVSMLNQTLTEEPWKTILSNFKQYPMVGGRIKLKRV